MPLCPERPSLFPMSFICYRVSSIIGCIQCTRFCQRDIADLITAPKSMFRCTLYSSPCSLYAVIAVVIVKRHPRSPRTFLPIQTPTPHPLQSRKTKGLPSKSIHVWPLQIDQANSALSLHSTSGCYTYRYKIENAVRILPFHISKKKRESSCRVVYVILLLSIAPLY